MARNKSSRSKISIPSKYILLFLSIICICLIILSYATEWLVGPLETVAGYTIIPFQRGISYAGSFLTDKSDNVKKIEELSLENEELKKQVDDLTIQINSLMEDKYELAELRQLYALSEKYKDYETTAARVIGKDAGNWYSSFLIDKGTNDGIEVDMNVCAGAGLVGIVTAVGPNWATVRSIIDDSSNVSAMVLNTSDTMIVSGSLELFSDGYLNFTDLIDDDNRVEPGDQIVTSHISNKYLPGLSIGYITEINKDANNLTKSGHITTVVDFKHLSDVLVITQLKQVKE